MVLSKLTRIVVSRQFGHAPPPPRVDGKRGIFITGTDTDVGKTVVCSWLCLHSGWDYFKPIVSGSPEGESDSALVKRLSGVITHPETYNFNYPVSPHLAAKLSGVKINLEEIRLPSSRNKLIVEGAGGLLVPLNQKDLLVDLIQRFHLDVILVAKSKIGTINHTLLSLEALRRRSVPVLGVIVKGIPNQDNSDAIQHFGQTKILAQVPYFETLDKEALLRHPLTPALESILT